MERRNKVERLPVHALVDPAITFGQLSQALAAGGLTLRRDKRGRLLVQTFPGKVAPGVSTL